MTSVNEKGGFFEQIQGKINPVVVKYYYGPRMEDSDASFPYLVKVMEAHVLMLQEQKIIPRKIAGKLVEVMERWGESIPEIDPSLEDLYINMEHLMSQEAGKDTCSYLPVARSRNDVEAAMWRIELRERLCELADALMDMISILHKRAEETVDYIFPGYTYGQQAQPVNMGFHLLGIASPLLREVERIIQCVDRFNKNPLGAAAMSGTEYPISRERTGENPSAVVGLCILLFLIVVSIVGPFVVQSPYEQDTAIKLMPPSSEHWFGTDDFGRDVFARIVTGANYSLLAGFVSVALGLTGGLLIGAFAGFYGGILDQILMTICDILLAFPSVLLAMAIVMVMEPGIYTPMVAVGISSIPIFARLVRAQFMSLRESCFVEAVRSSGASDLRIIFRHLLPNSIGPIIIQATLRIGSSILLAATLSFLGLGAQPPTPEWGSMLSSARNYVWTASYLAIIPGLAITITVVAVNLIGDALRDYLDPRTRNM